MAKRKDKVVPDEDIKDVISDNKKSPSKGASVKTLGIIIKPLSETKDKEDVDALSDSSLRSPIEALLMHEYAKHEIGEHGTDSDDDIVCSIKHLLHGVQRENGGFLRDREHFDKDLGVISSILTDVLPKGNNNIRELIARALFGKRDGYEHEGHGSEIGPPSIGHTYGKMKKEGPSTEIMRLLK